MAYWCSVCSNAGAVPVCCGQEGAELEGEALDLQVHPGSNPHLIRMAPGRLPLEISGHVQLGGDTGADPEPAGGIIYLIWLGNASGSPRRNWRAWLGRRKPGGPFLSGCHRDPAPDKQMRMDGWMDKLSGCRCLIISWSGLRRRRCGGSLPCFSYHASTVGRVNGCQ